MNIDEPLIERIARLAMIGLSAEELAVARGDLQRILDMMQVLQGVDTRGVEPLAHPLDLAQRLRADEVTEGDRRDAFQATAPLTRDGLYLVPRVVE